MCIKLLYDVCEPNGNAKHPAKPFLQSGGKGGGGVLWDRLAHRGSGNSNTSGI
jgi:hypothetical protein